MMCITRKANEIQLLPILAIYFRGSSLNNKRVFIKNVGRSSAFGIKIEAYHYVYLDIQTSDKIVFSLPGTNVLNPGEELELEITATRNDEPADIKEFMTYLLDPTEKFKGKKTVKLIATFRNAEGNHYYSKFITGNDGLLIEPAKRLNFRGRFYLWRKNVDQCLFFARVHLIWRFKKPHISTVDSTKNWFLRSIKSILWRK